MTEDINKEIMEICQRAVTAKYEMAKIRDRIDAVLLKIADGLVEHAGTIIEANRMDLEAAKEKGMHPGLIDRLMLNSSRIEAMAVSLRQVSTLPTPLGRVLESRVLENGLDVKKVSVPMGVIGIIYESRPNVTADAFGLCFKAGSGVILKGGSDAINSNIAITDIIRTILSDNNINPDCIQIVKSTDRAVTRQLMTMKSYIDVLIPRGGAGLIKDVVENSLIPVIETGTGNCHIYIDRSADIDMAVEIINNAKTSRIGVCNACESIVIHRDIADRLMKPLWDRLSQSRVEIRGDRRVCDLVDGIIPATEEDYGREYLDYILSAKTVDSIEEAIAHINQYSTGHSESIISNDTAAIELFMREVDSACVYANASTRFTDGFELGLGAEIGISTQKLHARGPMGLNELTTYKYLITGNGQIRK